MGQKISPIGFRTGVTRGWQSRWFAPGSNFGEFLVEDEKVRRFIDNRLNRQPPYAAISAVEIERTREEVKVFIKTARPGLVIGPKGSEVDKLKDALESLTNRRVNINIVEVKSPDLDAQLIAEGISEQLKRRASFRRTLKQRAEAAMQAGAKGVKIALGGRLGGAEMGRRESVLLGSIPLHTLSADVDYGFSPCITTYGSIGVKVWVYRGRFGEEPPKPEASAGGRPPRRRREGGGRGERPGRGGGKSGRSPRRGGASGGGQSSQAGPQKSQSDTSRQDSSAGQSGGSTDQSRGEGAQGGENTESSQ
ncbi:MAG: 30S ribosomal protein S3 [Phycisphaerae bacterium]